MEFGNGRGKLSSKHYVLAGATSGAITRCIGQPLDVLKIRFQLQNLQNGKLKYVGLISSSVSIVKAEGISALWKGLIPAQILSVIYGAVQFSSYEVSRKYATKLYPTLYDNSRLKAVSDFACGGFGGVCSSVVCQPFDVLRTRLVAQSDKVYRSIYHAVVLMMRENGIPTFYKGLIPTLSMIFPYSGLNFAFYGIFKHTWMGSMPVFQQDTRMMQLSCGSLSGLCSKLILLPFDMVKKRLQVQGFQGYSVQYNGMIHCFLTVARTEGFSALYRGASPSVVKACVTSGVTFFSYEQVCDLLVWYESR